MVSFDIQSQKLQATKNKIEVKGTCIFVCGCSCFCFLWDWGERQRREEEEQKKNHTFYCQNKLTSGLVLILCCTHFHPHFSIQPK